MNNFTPISDPTQIFFVVLMIILFAPIIMGKLRIPHIIGLVLAGVLVGQYGFDILERDASFELFGKVGVYYIMFLAALEMDMRGLMTRWRQILLFGLMSFCIPFLLTIVGYNLISDFDFAQSQNTSLITCILLGCIMSSNTLVSYPIVARYGLQKKPSVTLSVGATMISLLLSLVVLASVVAAHEGSGESMFWLWFALKFIVFVCISIFIIPRITRYFLRRYSDAVMQYIFVMAEMIMLAVFSEFIGLEGIFGAFLAGIILNRYIPHASPLMNRLEFTGNALFIPYFLIGVGMLVNLRILFTGEAILWLVGMLVFFGTAGKLAASYLAAVLCRLPRTSGRMMFGLSSAHAAGAIAMVMVGLGLKGADGMPLISEGILNGVIMMILFTCVISTLVTENAAKTIVLRDQDIADVDLDVLCTKGKASRAGADDEKILVPVKYPEYANRLISLALLMRNAKLKRPLSVLSVVYDDEHLNQNREKGYKLLDQVTDFAASSDVAVESQVRVAANIANGIKHAFIEFRASEIIIGMHTHFTESTSMWGQFHQSLFNGMHQQIIMARLNQPLPTLRHITVVVPSRAQYEAGFYRWLERLCRLSEGLSCDISFHARQDTMLLIKQFVSYRHQSVKAEYIDMEHWNELPHLAQEVSKDHLFVVVTARKGTVSYKNAQERILEELATNTRANSMNLLIIFPDQHGEAIDQMTFAQSQHTEEKSYYDLIHDFFYKRLGRR